MNTLLTEIFAGIFVSIACWDRHSDFLAAVTNLPNSTALNAHSVQWWYTCVSMVVKTSFIDEWRKFIFVSFYFHICDFTLENKHLAKISTCTVFDIKKIILLTVGLGGHSSLQCVHMPDRGLQNILDKDLPFWRKNTQKQNFSMLLQPNVTKTKTHMHTPRQRTMEIAIMRAHTSHVTSSTPIHDTYDHREFKIHPVHTLAFTFQFDPGN